MKKLFVLTALCALALAAQAANAPAKKAKTAKKPAAKPVMEFVVVESPDYASGKHDPQITTGLATFLEGEAKVTTMDYNQAKQEAELANVDYSFLPVYLLAKTPKALEKFEQPLKNGYIKETGKYLVLPKMSRTGVFQDKIAQPGVLELFVMSQCPYGAMAENLIIQAQKDGKIPADKTIKVRYIVNYNKDTGEFQSLHGSAEWEENIRQLLIAKYYPSKFWKYLEIRNQDYRSSRWDKAMKEAGINPNKIMKKFDTEGVELLKAEAAYVDEYGMSASPSFLWEGKELLDFGSVSQKPGLEFLNPANARQQGGKAAPAGSC